jgi:WD40 repeat protein
LEHPGVVPVYGLGQDADGRPCYAMRFIQGESMKEAIERFHAAERPGRDPGERRLALRQLLTSFVTVCKTMAYAHSRGVLHRDLKPANIMLGKYGETLVVDWGLARSFERDENARSLGEASLTPSLAGAAGETQVGQMVGTPAFVSPEQAAGLWDVVGPASDIFSLGATLYNLLTNQSPYDGSGVLEIIAQACAGEVIPPRRRKKDVPPALEAICLKAMAHKRTDRYATALELAADVEDWLADEPVTAHRESVAERLGRIGRRHRAAVVAGVAGLCAVVFLAAALGLARLWKQERTQRQTADAAKAEAEQAKGEAQQQRELAAQAKKAEEVQRQLAEERATYLRVANGVALLDQGDPFGALLWFAKALANENRGTEYEVMHRWRIGSVLAQCPRLSQIWRHEEAITYAEFSPDGRRVVTTSGDQTARVWDAASGLPVTPPLKHTAAVWHASFSPDGRRLITGSGEVDKPVGEALIWDVAGGSPVMPPIKHSLMVHRVAFSPNGRQFVTATGGDSNWWKILAKPGKARVWDARTGLPVTPPLKHDAWISHASFSPDGRRIVTSSGDGTARVWDAVSGLPITPPLKHDVLVTHATFSPDGRRVLTASWDQTARVWGATSGLPLTSGLKHKGPVHHATFSPDGRRVLAASSYGDATTYGEAQAWDSSSGQPLTPPLKHKGLILHVSFSSDGRRILTAGGDQFRSGEARVWDVVSGQPLTPPLKHFGQVKHASFSPDGRHVLTVSSDGTARLWEVATVVANKLRLTHRLGGPFTHRSARTAAAFSSLAGAKRVY